MKMEIYKYTHKLKFLFVVIILASKIEPFVIANANSNNTWVGSKYKIQCTMCSACDNPCNTPSPPPPPSITAISPPPPSPPPSSGTYYNPPQQTRYSYYQPPPQGCGATTYSPPQIYPSPPP
ncbi:hypothetical protein CASFOL_018149 [Castilleja foliolosa]|uniref:Uncharacterized protein n=1 Tax=Castilleja foliolosa TaxID=1961234 RepID=A0ABD3D5Y1_9LAMI